jgi:hypothetical protein
LLSRTVQMSAAVARCALPAVRAAGLRVEVDRDLADHRLPGPVNRWRTGFSRRR